MFKCTRCPQLEARVSQLIDQAHEERKLARESADRERASFAAERLEWAKERHMLLSRIQGWSPDEAPKEPAPSRGTEVTETVDGVHSQEELVALGLMWDPEGNFYYDLRLNPPVTYETVEDAKDVRAFLKAKGFPENAHPALISDEGIEALVESAKKFRKDESAKEEDHQHAV